MKPILRSKLTTILVDKTYRLLGFMNADLHVSQQGLDLITKFEGYRSLPYICPAGYLTVGIGIRIDDKAAFLKKHPQGVSFTEAQEDLMHYIQAAVEPTIKGSIKVSLTQNQFDAIVSFIFNLGTGAFKKSSLLKLLNAQSRDVVEEFKKWNKATVHGKLTALPGLTRRRLAERLLFEGKEWRTV